ncbi:MAG: hypothetical protein LBT69_00085 [Lactobacillales bacterium]|nr:hypothetical protein [Lactobacillales bacterium]
MSIKNTIYYRIMQLVTTTYMHHRELEGRIETDIVKVSLEKGSVDSVSLYINDKPKIKIEVDQTKSNIIEFDQHDSNALKYILPFSKSLGISRIQIENYKKSA